MYKKLLTILLVLVVLLSIQPQQVQAQGLLNKVKKAVKKETNDVLDEVLGTDTGGNSGGGNDPGNYPGNNGSSNTEKRMMTPPDVMENIGYTENALSEKNYNDAIFSLQQALVGVEWHLGMAVLKSLPASVAGLDYDKDRDVVQSTGIGFIGLMISRFYGTDRTSVEFEIANNSALLSAYSMILSNPAYWNSTEDNRKAVRINGQKAVLEYKNDRDYSVGIPLGQSSIGLFEFANFESEEAVLKACEGFDLSAAVNILGD